MNIVIRNMEPPVNCRSCPFKELKIINDDEARYVMYKCLAADGVWICHDDLEAGRHPDCPIET